MLKENLKTVTINSTLFQKVIIRHAFSNNILWQQIIIKSSLI